MKKSVFTLLALLVCILSPLHAYEYFTIYFSDGTKSDAFYATDVDSICYSKLSLDSIAYDEWQVQEIYTCDSVYRYPLSQIDSLSFKDVDVNQVAEDIARVSAVLNPLYLKYHSTTEISHRLPLIENIEGVEKTWVDSQTLFVKIRNWETISYQYPVKSVNMPESINNPSLCQSRGIYKNINTANVLTHRHLYKKDVCIVNQHYKDIDYVKSNEAADTLKKWCSKLGLNVTVNNSPSPEFFAHDINKYGLVFIFTHGMYNGKHWLATSEEIYTEKIDNPINSDSLRKVADSFIHENYFKKGLSPTDINYVVSTENRGGDTVLVCNTWISNSYISKQGVSDSQETIIFNIACQSMKGNQEMGNAFINNGAVCYSGFSEVNTIGQGCSLFYLESLLSGYSSYTAVKTLPDGWWKEKVEWPEGSGNYNDSELILWPTNQNVTSVCITHPETLNQDTLEGDSESIIIKGRMKTFNSNLVDSIGFLVADNPEMDKANRYKAIAKEYDSETYYMNWESTLDASKLQPNTTYYYCAYMNDGYSYCYGEVKEIAQAEPYVVIRDNILTFYYDSHRREKSGIIIKIKDKYRDSVLPKWKYSWIKQAVVDSSFISYTPTSTAYWFSGLKGLSEINGIENINTEEITDMAYMFSDCDSLKSLHLSSFDTKSVKDMRAMFFNCKSLDTLELSNFNTANVEDMGRMFLGCKSLDTLDLSNFNTANVKDMERMFAGCESLDTLDLSNFNTANVKDMMAMFVGCSSFKSLDLSNFNTKNVVNMEGMFENCRDLNTLNISNFDFSNLRGGGSYDMFHNCLSLTSIIFNNGKGSCFAGRNWAYGNEWDSYPKLTVNMENFDATGLRLIFLAMDNIVEINLTHLHTDSLEMCKIADGCPSLKKVNMSSFYSNNLIKAERLFEDCSSLESIDMSNFDVPNLEILGDWLYVKAPLKYINLSNLNAPSLRSINFLQERSSLRIVDLCNINTPNLKRISFECDFSLEEIYVDNTWNNVKLDWDAYMFKGCTNLVGGQGTKIGNNLYGYDRWSGNPLYYYCPYTSVSAHIDGGKDNPGLFTAK